MDRDFQHGGGMVWHDAARHGHDGWWGGPLHAVFFLLFLGLLIAAVLWFARRLTLPSATAPTLASAGAPTPDPAVATLRMRYAKGEVSREDFQHALADLTGEPESWPGTEDTQPAP
ncbi:MAG: SHOCT domain-containing protein [Gaiellales bacterium]